MSLFVLLTGVWIMGYLQKEAWVMQRQLLYLKACCTQFMNLQAAQLIEESPNHQL